MKIHNPLLINWSQQQDGFYGMVIKESDGSPSYKGIKVLTFDRSSFYIGQNAPNIDEAIVSFRGSSGGTTTASNLGTGSGLFAQKVNDDLQFKTLTQGPGIKFNPTSNELRIDNTVEQFYGLTVKYSPNTGKTYRNLNTLAFEQSAFYIEQNSPNTDEATVNFRLPVGVVNTGALQNNAVTTAKIADAQVTTAKITDLNVTTAKIGVQAAGEVTASGFGGAAGIGSTSYVSFATSSIVVARSGSRVLVMASIQHSFVSGTTTIRISRAGSLVGSEYPIAITGIILITAVDTPGAGSHTYSIDVKNTTPAGIAGFGQITTVEAK